MRHDLDLDGTLSRRKVLTLAVRLPTGILLLRELPKAIASEPRSEALLRPVDAQGNLGEVIHAPSDPALWPRWREALSHWRDAHRRELGYDDKLYRRDEFAWASSCFACGFLMLFDEALYDPKAGRFTVDTFLDAGLREFGGYDAVVLWHAYPRIGVDDRNQFDFFRDMPGGLRGLAGLVRALRQRGVRAFIPYNPWDIGTRREDKPDLDALVEVVKAISADGIFLDTMRKGGPEFRAKLDAARSGVVLEGEGALPLDNIHDHHLSWAQWFTDSHAPGVLRNKWFEPRHMQHAINRWDRDHTAELHMAWMNGSGIMVWENVFGSWVGWSARDRSILRSMLPVQRRFARLFASGKWTPLVPTEAAGVFASLWEDQGLKLWTLVNRTGDEVHGRLLRVPREPRHRWADLIRGLELKPQAEADSAILTGGIPPRGIAAFVCAAPTALGDRFADFLTAQRALDVRTDFSTVFPPRQATQRPPERTRPIGSATPPPGMAEVAPVRFLMKTEFRIRECGFYDSQSDVSVTAMLHRPVVFERTVKLKRYAMDLTPVTNAQYAEFLRASGYSPRHRENFLKHWKGNLPPEGLDDHPVVYVDLDDARAYARWAGKRLPSEEEWQYAAQGPDERRYPWGNEMKPGLANAGEGGGTTPVTAFPAGRSPFGCYDMCGNTWEWTESERSDGRTRFAIIRGGSYYEARGSGWYVEGGPQPCDHAVKFILMWPGLDRCATIGFRCAVDL